MQASYLQRYKHNALNRFRNGPFQYGKIKKK